MSSEQAVLTERRGNVGVITLNRPKALNAWNRAMQAQCFDALDTMEADPEVRVIVVTGSGRAFCAGADMGMLSEAAQTQGGGIGDKKNTQGGLGSRDVLYPTTILKPVIAAVNGPVAGIGLSFALACDMRFAASDAKFLGAFSRRGLVAEYGTSWTVPNLIGTGNAMMFLLSSDKFSGEEAFRMGMVQRCFPKEELLDQTVEFAQHLADQCSPVSMAAMKLQVWNHPTRSLTEAVDESTDLMKLTIGGKNPDFKEGVLSFLQRRAPSFGPMDPKNVVIQHAKQLLMRSKL